METTCPRTRRTRTAFAICGGAGPALGILLAVMTGCGTSTEPSKVITGTAVTSSDGPIVGATVTLRHHGNAATAQEAGVDKATSTTDSSGAFRFEGMEDGWYSVSISWTIGRTTRRHQGLERHSDFLVAHYTNGTALALGSAFQYPATSVVAFVYAN